ncbi:MAG: hypothetical protein K2O69_00840 [Odoribacter sp.]|nr:hypothetical protein [Odoribacter sp.]
MGVFRSLIFDGLHKSVGNIVMYTSRGRAIVRGKPLSVHNPRTAAQQAARMRFRVATRLAAVFEDLLPLGFPAPYAADSRGAFVGENINRLEMDGDGNVVVDFRRLALSAGKQVPPLCRVRIQGNGGVAESFAQPLSAYAMRDDRVYVVLWETEDDAAFLLDLGTRGAPATQAFEFLEDWRPENLFAYAFAVSASGRHASDSVLLMAEGVAED